MHNRNFVIHIRRNHIFVEEQYHCLVNRIRKMLIFEVAKEIEKDVFFVLSWTWDKEKILSSHEESNPRPLDSVLPYSSTEVHIMVTDHRYFIPFAIVSIVGDLFFHSKCFKSGYDCLLDCFSRFQIWSLAECLCFVHGQHSALSLYSYPSKVFISTSKTQRTPAKRAGGNLL